MSMMETPMFLFGLKLARMPGNIEFFDADFCNAIQINSFLFKGLNLDTCCQLIN